MRWGVCAVILLTGCPATDAGPPDAVFYDPTLELVDNENRFVGSFEAELAVPGGTATFSFVTGSLRGATPGGGPGLGGVLTSEGLGLPAKLGAIGTFDPRGGAFSAMSDIGEVSISGYLPTRNTLGAQYAPTIVRAGMTYTGGETRRTSPFDATRDDRVLHIDQLTPDCNVTAGDFSNDMFKTLWLERDVYPQTQWYASIRDASNPPRQVQIRSLDINELAYDGVHRIGRLIDSVENATELTYIEAGSPNKQWNASAGRVIVDLMAKTAGVMTIHFEDLAFTPVESSGATGSFRMTFSGTTTAGDFDLNRNGHLVFEP